jgi:two-component system response regulator RstA
VVNARVLLVEDDPRLAELVAEYLVHHGFTVDREDNGLRAAQRIPKEQPDAVVLDLNLPGQDGLAVCRQVRPEYGGVILILTARADDLDHVLGLELGADAYVAKPCSPRVLAARLDALLRRVRGDWEEEEALHVGCLSMDRTRRSATVGGRPIELTTGEFDVLWLFSQRVGRVLTRDQILDGLERSALDAGDRAIDVTVSRLRHKLGDDPKVPTWFRTVRGVGYLFSPPDAA